MYERGTLPNYFFSNKRNRNSHRRSTPKRLHSASCVPFHHSHIEMPITRFSISSHTSSRCVCQSIRNPTPDADLPIHPHPHLSLFSVYKLHTHTRNLGDGLVHTVAKLVHEHGLSGLLVDEFGPLLVLGDETLVKGGVVVDPLLLADDVGDGLALRLEDGLDLGPGVGVEVLHLDDEGGLLELMERRGAGQGPLERIGNEGDDDVLALRNGGGEGADADDGRSRC
mmetsp:Transcript_20588/g.59028  ORF Transcript_20588/g.59028 Transcript_20588/m.59028 type:complete len:225 (-) Transcript_20588:75-749(-)